VVHASIVAAQRNLLSGLRGDEPAETTAADNLKTLRLVTACYDSAQTNAVVHLNGSTSSAVDAQKPAGAVMTP
jgi:hypothetical protein